MALSLLTACAEEVPFEVYEKPIATSPYVPASIRTCADVPQVPGEGARQRDVAVYVTDLHSVALECTTNLRAVDSTLRKHERRINDLNSAAEAEFESWKKSR